MSTRFQPGDKVKIVDVVFGTRLIGRTGTVREILGEDDPKFLAGDQKVRVQLDPEPFQKFIEDSLSFYNVELEKR